MPPLPPAPAKRAAVLPAQAYADRDAHNAAARKTRSARTTPAQSRKTAAQAAQAPALALNAAVPAAQPAVQPPASQPPAAQPAVKKPAKAAKTAKTRRAAAPETVKLFVLDTNVLLHDPTALFRFEEHDIFLPMVVLEELDAHKKGASEIARNARQVSRQLDLLVAHADMAAGLPLSAVGHLEAGGKLWFQTAPLHAATAQLLPQGKADNQILEVVAALAQQHAGRPVVLVTKDINMRVKARAVGLAAEDYENDKTLQDGDLLYSGALALPENFWADQGSRLESWPDGAHTFYRISGKLAASLLPNQFVWYEAPGQSSLYARVTEVDGQSATLQTLKDYTHPKNAVWGVTARNREQNHALNLLMDPGIDFVTITGIAGTGKTLLALAAGLAQVLDERRYTEVIMTRATVNVGEGIGFLPGTEEEKMAPWMGALDDNLEFLTQGAGSAAGDWGRAATGDLIRSRIKIKSMNFMRGRTFLNRWVIIDEAQNLTPKQIKTLITRAGPGSKIICMGNLAQIDTPYLTEGSSGLTYAVDRFKGWPHGGHITLARGERSRLADYASEVL